MTLIACGIAATLFIFASQHAGASCDTPLVTWMRVLASLIVAYALLWWIQICRWHDTFMAAFEIVLLAAVWLGMFFVVITKDCDPLLESETMACLLLLVPMTLVFLGCLLHGRFAPAFANVSRPYLILPAEHQTLIHD